MIFEINNTKLEVLNELNEYDDIIFSRFSQFKKIDDNASNNHLLFKNHRVEILIKDKLILLNNRVVKTDIYTIINNVISFLINDSYNTLIHGMVISKDDVGYLILGDFGQGKTTLSEELEKNNFEINSSDQTWLHIDENHLKQKIGSMFYIKDSIKYSLKKQQANKKIKINYIIRILGMCDKGKTKYEIDKNKYHNIKNLSQYCGWHMLMPLFTDNVELFNTSKEIKEFLINLSYTDVKYIDIRGDKKEIVNIIGDLK